jgi:hypothetical protein
MMASTWEGGVVGSSVLLEEEGLTDRAVRISVRAARKSLPIETIRRAGVLGSTAEFSLRHGEDPWSPDRSVSLYQVRTDCMFALPQGVAADGRALVGSRESPG